MLKTRLRVSPYSRLPVSLGVLFIAASLFLAACATDGSYRKEILIACEGVTAVYQTLEAAEAAGNTRVTPALDIADQTVVRACTADDIPDTREALASIAEGGSALLTAKLNEGL